MAIRFKNLIEDEIAGTVGFLRFVPRKGSEWLGALFLMNAMGEPVEFTHARLKAPSSALWHQDDLRTYCVRSLCVAMFDACPVSPLVILCRAEEVGPHLFSEQIQVDMPVGRAARSDLPTTVSPAERPEAEKRTEAGIEYSVYWTPDAPEPGSDARRLFDAVSSRGMLVEPFQRVEAGLREVYPDEAV
ncbi:MAG: hypothetical protein ACP5R5_01995 [Armatimonadota bacterium]